MKLPRLPKGMQPIVPQPFTPMFDVGELLMAGVKAFAFGAGVAHGDKITQIMVLSPSGRHHPNDRGRARRFNRREGMAA